MATIIITRLNSLLSGKSEDGLAESKKDIDKWSVGFLRCLP